MDISRYGPIIAGAFSIAAIIVGYILATQPINPLVNEPPVISDLVPNLPSPHVEGTPITWTAIASDPDQDILLYKFQLCGPSTANRYVDQQNWSPNPEWIWDSGHSDIGTNVIRVLVKDPKHEQSYFRNYTVSRSGFGEIIHSGYTKMNISETYPFMACVALNDSIETAQSEVRTFTHASDESPLTSNDSIEAAKMEDETAPIVAKTPMSISKDMSVTLNALTPGTFSIYLISPKSETQKIPQDDPGHNYATWIWDVTPIKIGTYDLILSAYDAEGRNRKAHIPITVTVKQASFEETPTIEEVVAAATAVAAEEPVNETALATAETVPEAEVEPDIEVAPAVETEAPAVEETANETATAAEETVKETAEAAKKETPGFESVFAITGLLAVAYLVLGRRK